MAPVGVALRFVFIYKGCRTIRALPADPNDTQEATMPVKRTTMRSKAGKKLYAVRDGDGRFKDIQDYARAHAQDMKRVSKAESAAKAKKAAAKKATPAKAVIRKAKPAKVVVKKAAPAKAGKRVKAVKKAKPAKTVKKATGTKKSAKPKSKK